MPELMVKDDIKNVQFTADRHLPESLPAVRSFLDALGTLEGLMPQISKIDWKPSPMSVGRFAFTIDNLDRHWSTLVEPLSGRQSLDPTGEWEEAELDSLRVMRHALQGPTNHHGVVTVKGRW